VPSRRSNRSGHRDALCAGLVLLLFLGTACTSPRAKVDPAPRAFDFSRDTFSYANELVWDYAFDEQGHWRGRPRHPRPDYTHHCFVVARAALLFHRHARFDPARPEASREDYRRWIREILGRDPRRTGGEPVTIPGFTGLREFSLAHPDLLQEECGAAWNSYFQRGHWRMILPFSRRHQATTAQELQELAGRGLPAVIHIVCFPSLRINHALVVWGVAEEEGRLRFSVYDPNTPEAPVDLAYDPERRTFTFPPTSYFPGGEVDIYQIYHAPLY
jgi:hypothetical protein